MHTEMQAFPSSRLLMAWRCLGMAARLWTRRRRKAKPIRTEIGEPRDTISVDDTVLWLHVLRDAWRNASFHRTNGGAHQLYHDAAAAVQKAIYARSDERFNEIVEKTGTCPVNDAEVVDVFKREQ